MGGSAWLSLGPSELKACANEGSDSAAARSPVVGGISRCGKRSLLVDPSAVRAVSGRLGRSSSSS